MTAPDARPERVMWDEVEYHEPLDGRPPYWAVFDLGSVIGVKATRYVRGDRLFATEQRALEAERERDALRQLVAAYEVNEAKGDAQYLALRAERVALVAALGNLGGDGVYYVPQERAFAPGVSGQWPEVIPAPHTPHGRLVKRTLDAQARAILAREET